MRVDVCLCSWWSLAGSVAASSFATVPLIGSRVEFVFMLAGGVGGLHIGGDDGQTVS